MHLSGETVWPRRTDTRNKGEALPGLDAIRIRFEEDGNAPADNDSRNIRKQQSVLRCGWKQGRMSLNQHDL